MELMVEGRKMVIQENSGLFKATISLKTMVRTIQEMGGGLLVELQSLEGIRMDERETFLLCYNHSYISSRRSFSHHRACYPRGSKSMSSSLKRACSRLVSDLTGIPRSRKTRLSG